MCVGVGSCFEVRLVLGVDVLVREDLVQFIVRCEVRDRSVDRVV